MLNFKSDNQMLSNKVKRNFWLTLAILSVGCVIDRVIRVIDRWIYRVVESGCDDCYNRFLHQILSLLPQTGETRQPFRSRQSIQVKKSRLKQFTFCNYLKQNGLYLIQFI